MKINLEPINVLRERLSKQSGALKTENYSREEVVDALDIIEQILFEIPSLKQKDVAENLLEEIKVLREILIDFPDILNIIDTSSRSIEQILPNLLNCDKVLVNRINILERFPPKCTKCDNSLIIREGNGIYFWGCPDFPDCWGKRYLTKEEEDWIYYGKRKDNIMSKNIDKKLTLEESPEEGAINDYEGSYEREPKENLVSDNNDTATIEIDLLCLLADGYHPFTGETFEHDHICQNLQVSKALHNAITALKKENSRQKRKIELPKNAGKSWSQKDDEKLLTSFKNGSTVKELAEIFERTTGSIRSRLLNFGYINENHNE